MFALLGPGRTDEGEQRLDRARHRAEPETWTWITVLYVRGGLQRSPGHGMAGGGRDPFGGEARGALEQAVGHPERGEAGGENPRRRSPAYLAKARTAAGAPGRVRAR